MTISILLALYFAFGAVFILAICSTAKSRNLKAQKIFTPGRWRNLASRTRQKP
jgi:hypothetical protein